MASRQSPMRIPRETRERAAYLRGTGMSLKATAKEVGVGKSTVHGWETPGGRHYDPGYVAIMKATQEQILADIDRALGRSVGRLADALEDDSEKIGPRDLAAIAHSMAKAKTAIEQTQLRRERQEQELALMGGVEEGVSELTRWMNERAEREAGEHNEG